MAEPHVRAAGAVLWRPAGQGPDDQGLEVAVVHRPKYDDWSLPKGKADDGEPDARTAVREVTEETGFGGVLGRTLGTTTYPVLLGDRSARKTVSWWAMRAGEGAFRPGPEVDELRWLDPAAAAALLTAGRDVPVVERLTATALPTATLLLVRHGSAGRRRTWTRPDEERPLDDRGRVQAQRLVPVLELFGVERVLSAPLLRCLDTVAPLADRLGLPVEREPLLSEDAWQRTPGEVLARLRTLARPGAAVVLGSQGGAVPGMLEALADEAGVVLADDRAPKGSCWAVSLSGGRLVDAARLDI